MAQSQEGRMRDLRDAADAGMTLTEYRSWGNLWPKDDCGSDCGTCDVCASYVVRQDGE